MVASPEYTFVPRAGSPEYRNIPRAGSPEYRNIPRAGSPRYKVNQGLAARSTKVYQWLLALSTEMYQGLAACLNFRRISSWNFTDPNWEQLWASTEPRAWQWRSMTLGRIPNTYFGFRLDLDKGKQKLYGHYSIFIKYRLSSSTLIESWKYCNNI